MKWWSKLSFAAAAIASSMVLAGPAASQVINFNDNPDGTYFLSPITSNGFVATGNLEFGNTPLGTNVSVDGYGPSNGTVHLDAWTNYGDNSIWTLTQQDGGIFSLFSFDFASGYNDGSSQAELLSLTGITALGTTVTQQFGNIGGNFMTLTVDSSFTNLTSVRFDAFGTYNRSAYDNINVLSAVPEPGTWAMMLLGFGAVGYGMRRRRRTGNAVPQIA